MFGGDYNNAAKKTLDISKFNTEVNQKKASYYSIFWAPYNIV